MNGKFVQRQGCELAVECYHEPHQKSLKYGMHCYWPYNICDPLSDPAVSAAGKEPTRGPRVHYCYSSALQNGGKYVDTCGYDMCILSGIVYRAMPTKACGLLVLYFCHNIFVSYPSLLIPALITYKIKLILCFSVQFSCKLRSACQQKNGHCIISFLPHRQL